jgi:acyl-CoA synthetase (AMP-forming)/AMP-acid ligase II
MENSRTFFNNFTLFSECPKEIDADLDDPLLILCTSGTTGKSKGAVYTNLQLLAFTIGTSNIPYNEKPAMLVLRCTHVLGMLFPIRNLKAGVWSILMSEITKENIFIATDKYKPQLAFGFATFLVLLAIDPEAQKYDRSSLEVIITGGMVLTEKFYKDMMSLPSVKCVFNGYGMTECAALTTTIDLSGLSQGYKMMPNIPTLSCGKLYPNTSLKILDLDTGRGLGPNQQGEIAIASPIMCSGYWNADSQTQGLFQNGWMKTGDLGYYDNDGFVYVVDRIKETFKFYNCHVS